MRHVNSTYLFSQSYLSLQQLDSDPWTNSNQRISGGGNALAVARARADVLARAALIIRTSARLEKAMATSATPVRPVPIDVARFRLGGKNGYDFDGDFDAIAFAVNVNNLGLIDFVLCLITQTAFFRAKH